MSGSPLQVSVGEVMRPGVVTCVADDGVATLAAIMATHGIHAVVVGPLEGSAALVASDLDVLRAALQRSDARARELASKPIATVDSDAPLADAVRAMSEHGTSHLLVTASGAPAGVVSTFDVAAVLGGQEPRLARMIRPGPARPSSSARSLTEARVASSMHVGIATCAADASLATVARSMAEQRVHCIAVAGMRATGRHVDWGLIGDLDLVTAAHRGGVDQSAAAIVAASPLLVNEDDSLEHAATLMVEHDTHHVVVSGPSGVPAGIVSTLDIASILGAAA